MNEITDPDAFVYQPVDSAVPVAARERHTEHMTFRLSPRGARALSKLAADESTSESEIVREALVPLGAQMTALDNLVI